MQPAPEGDVSQLFFGGGTRCSACPGLPTGLDTHGHKDGEAVRDTDGSQSPGAGGETQKKAFAAMCQSNFERERTENKARQQEHKIRPTSFAG